MKTVFIRVVEAPVHEKADALRVASQGLGFHRYQTDPRAFAQVPRSPFAYWTSASLRRCFVDLRGLSDHSRFCVVSTNPLNEDFRYARLLWEPRPPTLNSAWLPWAKGGAHSPYYYDVHTAISWSRQRGSYGSFIGTVNRPLTRPASVQHFFRPGLTWPRRTQGGLSMRVMPRGCIFADKGPAAFVDGDPTRELFALAAIANSRPFHALVDMQMAFGSYEVGVIQRTPVPDLSDADQARLADLARRAWSLKRALDTRTETSHAFSQPALLQVEGDTLQARARAWSELSAARSQGVAAIQAEIDERCFDLYGLGPEDRRSIEVGFGPTEASDEPDDEDRDDDERSDDELDTAPLVASLLSWCLGVAFGRFDVRLATGARPLPPEPEPFDPLPACSPGMLTGEDGLPLDAPPSGYPLAFPTDGLLVDDPGHPRDLVKSVRAVFDKAFNDAHARWHEAAELVGARGGDLRDWFARTYFGEHIKRYSKSRRKAPIYWQLATASGSYSVWVYIHRATPDTLFRVLNDFVGPKLDHEREKLDRQTRDAGPNPSRTDRDSLAAQEAFVDELQALRAEVARVAPLWKPDLDDGVLLNFAPLWRLVPQERSWQTECRKAWDKLCAGEYDWAHLAMHLWPERVVPKCTEDRSLAIAHGLEDVFWREDGSGNWHAVDVTEVTLRQLVEERTSSSVKAALKDLLAAPAPTGKSGGRRAPSAPARVPAPRRAAPVVSTPARTSTAEVDEPTLTAVRAAIAAVAEGASKADVQATTGLSDADWNCAIAVLLERGDVTRTGQKRGTRYHPKGEPHA